MILKILDKKTGLEKLVKTVRRYDLIFFQCDNCKIYFTRKHRPNNPPIDKEHFCEKCGYKKTNLERYGSELPQQSDVIKERIKQTKLKNKPKKIKIKKLPTPPAHSNIIKVLDKKTGLEKPFEKIKKNDLIVIKCESCEKEFIKGYRRFAFYEDYAIFCKRCLAKRTCIKKYGVDNPSRVEEINDRRQNTCVKRYGVNTSLKDPKIKNKIKATNIKIYGVENPSQAKSVILKRTNTFIKNFGVSNPSLCPNVVAKTLSSKRKNGTFNTSKPEEKLYEILKAKYPNVKRQYSDDRYPFACDFYIPDKDMFIELQLFWSHGKEPFIGTEKQLIKLNEWQEKTKISTFYKNVIETWTARDPLKRETAKKNDLNYFEIFDLLQIQNLISR